MSLLSPSYRFCGCLKYFNCCPTQQMVFDTETKKLLEMLVDGSICLKTGTSAVTKILIDLCKEEAKDKP